MIVKAAIGFLNTDPDSKLIEKVQGALTGLTGNAAFPTPSPTLAAVTTALSAFQVALADAVNGGKEMTSIKNTKRAELASLMRQLASYVTVTASGDINKLLSSGFPYQKPTAEKVGTLPMPTAPTLKQGALSGQLDANTGAIYGASTYNWNLALSATPDKSVVTIQSTSARASFKDLTPGLVYSVTVNAVGAAGPSDYSDNAEMMVV